MLVSLARAATVVDTRAISDERDGNNWLSYGRTYSEDHYSPLPSINTSNVNQLGLAWFLDLPGERTLEAPPLEIDGTLYFSGTYGRTFAVDARNGKRLWTFDPELAKYSPERLRLNFGAHRGVAYWMGKIYVGTNDGRLVALDAATGRIAWSVQTLEGARPRSSISGAPRVFNGKVIIGHGGGDIGARCYVTAYDAATGRLAWRFYTVPGDPAAGFESDAMALAATTWNGRWWEFGGGGCVWDSMTYDPDFNRIYIGTGNAGVGDADVRSPGGNGSNLFAASIVALDADTGKYAWHYQETPRDTWDYDATQTIAIAPLQIDGRGRKVLMQASKNGFFYVIDRATGKLVSADQFAKTTWASRVDLATGLPVETDNANYQKGPKVIWPSNLGAHSWQPMSFSPRTGLVYIPTMKLAARYGAPVDPARSRSNILEDFLDPKRLDFLTPGLFGARADKIEPDDATSGLLAWDPVHRVKKWEVHYADSVWNGGTLATAGNLVFQGTGRGRFIAYDAADGRELWYFDAGLGIVAAPVAYNIAGTEYVSILVGYGGVAGFGGNFMDYGWRFGEQPRRLLTFALGKSVQLPVGAPPRYEVKALDDATLAINVSQAAVGAALYHESCLMCHGAGVVSVGSLAPDLRESPVALHWSTFRSVLHDGRLAAFGMPKYDELSNSDMRAIFLYIRDAARQAIPAAHTMESSAPERN